MIVILLLLAVILIVYFSSSPERAERVMDVSATILLAVFLVALALSLVFWVYSSYISN